MSINECTKSDNGSIAGTNTGRNEAVALQNQQNWGEDFVCKDSATGDFYVLNGAVAASNRAVSGTDPKKQSSDLKRDINNLIGEISSLQVQIDKYKKEVAASDNSGGFFSKPAVVTSLEMLGLAVGFGGIVPFLEDARHLVRLNNPQELVDRTNRNIQQMGGCGAVPNAPVSTAGKVGKWGAAAIAAGGIVALDALTSNGSGGGQASPVSSPSLPSYADTMNANELQAVYDKLIVQQQALVKEKIELERKIASKPDQKGSAVDKLAGNTAFKAAAVFGVFGLAVPAIRDGYFQSAFHKKVMAAEEALNLRAQQLAVQAMATGQCSAEAVTAQETVKATVTADQQQFSMADVGAALLPAASPIPYQYAAQIDGQWYSIDPARVNDTTELGRFLKQLAAGPATGDSWATATSEGGFAIYDPSAAPTSALFGVAKAPVADNETAGYDLDSIRAVAYANERTDNYSLSAAPTASFASAIGGLNPVTGSPVVFAAPSFTVTFAPVTVPVMAVPVLVP